MKKILFVLFAMFFTINLFAQVGGTCNFNDKNNKLHNGKITKYEKTTTIEDRNEDSYKVGGEVSGTVFGIGAKANGGYSNTSGNKTTTTIKREGYECCSNEDNNNCSTNYREGESKSAKRKYLKP